MDKAEIKAELSRLVGWINSFEKRSEAEEYTDTDEVWQLLEDARATLTKINRAIGSAQGPTRASRPTSSRRGSGRMVMLLQMHGETPMQTAVQTLEDASEKFKKWRDVRDLAASDLGEHAGEVLDGRTVIARISYNGRIWPVG